MTSKELKRVPMGEKDNASIKCTNFASNKAKTELRTGEGRDFDNDVLLKMLGFKENAEGLMSIQAHDGGRDYKYNAEILPNGEIVRKEKKAGKTTENRQASDEMGR